MTIIVRPLKAMAEFHACETLQRLVWAMDDNLDVVPLHLLLAAHRNGGVVLGAFHDGKMVGFVFGFLGLRDKGAPKHCSHIMGVDPEYQSAGIGYRLKLAQREFALDQGLDLVTWTYDPLESRNAYLNIGKLGALCRTYIPDYYGPMADGLNAGLPSDRFEVEWWITRERVQRRLERQPIPPSRESAVQVIITGRTPADLLAPASLILDADAPRIQVEIPADFQVIKGADPGLALKWRMAVRQVVQSYFARGYIVHGFLSKRTDLERRSYYILRTT